MRIGLLATWLSVLIAMPVSAHDGRLVVLLGETDGYLAAAARYWSERWSETHVVHGVGSLAELREILATHPNRGAAPWREVVLVSHASEWSGLPLPLYPGEDSVTPHDLHAARSSGAFPGLRASTLDAATSMRIEGCGIGRRPDVLEALADLLSAERLLRLTASPHLVAYLEEDIDSVRRRELPYASRIVHDLRRHDAVLAELGTEVRAALGDDTAQPLRSELRPVGVRLQLPRNIADSGARPERIAARYQPLRQRLRELGFTPAQLRWSIERTAGNSHAELVGQAFVLVVSPDVGVRLDGIASP
ncbi:MAG TPA: hypothetical protein PKZ76_02510 [Xanthomonadaceae bacterium]|nr:hypothetical protein [Xanthomonadaceae bacterium]